VTGSGSIAKSRSKKKPHLDRRFLPLLFGVVFEAISEKTL